MLMGKRVLILSASVGSGHVKAADALARVLGDAALRERLSAGAVRWAGTFTWERCAQESREVARRALEAAR